MAEIAFLSKPPASEFVEEWYEMAVPGHFWMDWRMRAFAAQLRDLQVPLDLPWKGLDIGCGTGVVCKQLEAISSWQVDGTDINENALRRNESRRGRTLLYNIHERIPAMARAYDCIVLFDVLEHIADPRAYLESVLFHLKPGGWLFINVPAFELLRSEYDRVVGHLRRYDRRSLTEELKGLPLEIQDLRYWGASLVPLLALRSVVLKVSRSSDVTRRGFRPPTEWINDLLKVIQKAETRILPRPWVGTSLLAAARKTI